MTSRMQADPIDTKHIMSVLDTIKSPILLLDHSHRLIALNEQARQLFEVPPDAIAGVALTELPHGEDLSRLFDSTHTLVEWTFSEKVFAPSVEAAPHGWTVILQDVSHYKRLNHGQSESMRYLLHDLRSPLTAIQGFASMMDSVGELNDKQKHFVSKVLSGVSQMTALVENVQDAGRYDPDTGTYQVMRTPTDIGAIARKIVENHLAPADKTLSVTVAVADDLPIINADETMLQRAINNLVDNAIKYTPDGGKIHVSVTRADNKIMVAVQDTGLGISAQNQRLLFERHARIFRQEHKRIKGTGLGLFIVRSVAKRHGGDAWVESEEGKGSTFLISIPLEGANLLSVAE